MRYKGKAGTLALLATMVLAARLNGGVCAAEPTASALSENFGSCSTFLLKRDDALVVGHNLDTGGIKLQPGMIVVNKRDVEKESRTWLDLTSNEKPGNRFRWVSKYGSITGNAMGREFPDGGLNEAGLVVCEMTLGDTEFIKDDTLPQIFMVQWIQFLLDTCKSVDEVVRHAKQTALSGWPGAWHFFTTDATGNVAVIEYLEGKAVIYRGDSLPIPLLCNTPYSEELKRIRKYWGFGGLKRISKSDSEPRFVTAGRMLKTDDASEPAAQYAFSILDRIGKIAMWSIVYDIPNRSIAFHTPVAPEVRRLSMKDLDFSCDTPALAMDINSDLSGDVRAALRPWTPEMNRSFIAKDVERIARTAPWFVELLASQGVSMEAFTERLATYPESTKCRTEAPERTEMGP